MSQRRLLLLGGSGYLLPVIEKAHELGIYVITCDYLPHNVAHRFSDEYCNASVVEKDAILQVARQKKIDGIMSFACDPGVVSAAYVAERMGLPFQCSYESALILQDKGRFRRFLLEHGFNSPHARSYANAAIPVRDYSYFNWPVIVKPVDSAGSKGVSKVVDPRDLAAAIEKALSFSRKKSVIVEDFLEFESSHSSTDMFTVNGRLCAVSYSDQFFDGAAENPYVPSTIIWPSTMPQQHQHELSRELQRLMDLLGVRTGIYNIETVVGKGGVPYIMEVSPRGGGCRIAEIQELAFGSILIENEIRNAVGLPLIEIKTRPVEGVWCEAVIYSRSHGQGIFERLEIAPELTSHLRKLDLFVKRGDVVSPFTGANCSLGDAFFQFESREQMREIFLDEQEGVRVLLRETQK